uniref:Uncharacterized protein n=1 Tax=Oryza punctata TaxID=4537 RepID=A0A0E0L051_ORYPU
MVEDVGGQGDRPWMPTVGGWRRWSPYLCCPTSWRPDRAAGGRVAEEESGERPWMLAVRGMEAATTGSVTPKLVEAGSSARLSGGGGEGG